MESMLQKLPGLRRFFADRRGSAMLGLGFSSGLPFLLVYVTQSAWLTEAKVPIEIIGLMSELTLAYKFKFLWAPFLDQHDAPLFGRLLGRRRGWIVVSQLAVMLALAGVAFGDPAQRLWWTLLFSFALGFAGATQDVVIDGWRITAAPKTMQAAMSAYSQIGYRVGILCAGAGALVLADHIGWRGAYLVMALLMLPGVVAALAAPEPPRVESARAHFSLKDTIIDPIKEIAGRLGPLAIPTLTMIALFRAPDYISGVMAIPLYKALGHSNTDIATVTKFYGFWVALGGIAFGGWLVPRIGMKPALLIGTASASAAHLGLAYLAAHAASYISFAVAVSIENFASAFASTVLIAYMSALTSQEHAGSQFALLTSLCALPGSLVAAGSGFAVRHMGFEMFFIMTSLIGVPIVLLYLWIWRQEHKRPISA
jgi:PAT family beta-lactamase induction signal transducer AmpG